MGYVKISVHIKFYLAILVLLVLLSPQITPHTMAYTDTYTDNKGDVIIDKGYTDVFDFSIPKLYHDAPYLDLISMKYNFLPYPETSKIDLTLSGPAKNNSAYYWIVFKGYTGKIEGPSFSIDALDTVADFNIGFEMNNVTNSEISFYDASIDQSYDNQTFVVTVDGNHLIIEFTVPQDFELSKVMTQESFDYLVSTEMDVGNLIASDDMSNSHQTYSNALFLFLKYWWVLLLIVIAIPTTLFIIYKKRKSTTDYEFKTDISN